MMRKKLMMISSVHPIDDPRIFHKEAKTLAVHYDVELYGVSQVRDRRVDGVRMRGLPFKSHRISRMGNDLYLLFKVLFERADIVHFHDPELLPVGWLAKKLTGKKVIYDVHEDYEKAILSKYWIAEKRRKTIARWFRKLEAWMSRSMDGIVTVTDSIADKFPREKVVQVRNYPFAMAQNETTSSSKEQKDGLTLIYAGALTRVRGVREMVEALDYLEKEVPVRLILVGEFDEPALQKEITELAGTRNVTMTGRVPYEEVYRYLSQADIGLVCLHPVKQYLESLPIKMFEYMSMGLAVVASDFPLWQEIVEGAGCGVTVDPLNPEDIAKAILELTKDEDNMRRMGDRGREAFQKEYNWKAQGDKLLAFYTRLFSHHPERSRRIFPSGSSS